MRIVCISDTHTMHDKVSVPNGDVLIHSGDATYTGTIPEVGAFGHWFSKQPHKHKIFVAGNHDIGFQEAKGECVSLLPYECHYLEDSGIEIDGIKFWGSPWQPYFCNWAFNLKREEERKPHWDLIPEGTNVLITHCPPKGILDSVPPNSERVGCSELLLAVKRIKPKIHLFGHIHENYGEVTIGETRFLNVATCDGSYKPVNSPVVIDL